MSVSRRGVSLEGLLWMTGEFERSTAGVCLEIEAHGKQMVPRWFPHEGQLGPACVEQMMLVSVFICSLVCQRRCLSGSWVVLPSCSFTVYRAECYFKIVALMRRITHHKPLETQTTGCDVIRLFHVTLFFFGGGGDAEGVADLCPTLQMSPATSLGLPLSSVCVFSFSLWIPGGTAKKSSNPQHCAAGSRGTVTQGNLILMLWISEWAGPRGH